MVIHAYSENIKLCVRKKQTKIKRVASSAEGKRWMGPGRAIQDLQLNL